VLGALLPPLMPCRIRGGCFWGLRPRVSWPFAGPNASTLVGGGVAALRGDRFGRLRRGIAGFLGERRGGEDQ